MGNISKGMSRAFKARSRPCPRWLVALCVLAASLGLGRVVVFGASLEGASPGSIQPAEHGPMGPVQVGKSGVDAYGDQRQKLKQERRPIMSFLVFIGSLAAIYFGLRNLKFGPQNWGALGIFVGGIGVAYSVAQLLLWSAGR